MSDDLLSELTLIDLSRCQRAALERWVPILLTAGETEIAAEIMGMGSLARIEAAEQREIA